MTVTVLSHPLVQHKLSLLRQKTTSTAKFRSLMHEISLLIGYEVTRDLPTELVEIETPIASMKTAMLMKPKPALISIMRAGTGMLDGFLQLLPSAHVGHIGLYREAGARSIVEYYLKLPADLGERHAIVVDPLLATGHSAVVAVNRIKDAAPRRIDFACILAADEGIERLSKAHPDIRIFTAAIDKELNDKKYIVPGLGDAGDRLFGTNH